MNAESLRKILELEKQRGYADAAVIGGLDKFLRQWSEQAAASITSPVLLRRFRKLFKTGYAALSIEQRRKWAQDVLAFLDEMEKKEDCCRAGKN